jgi:dolichol kinase
LSGLFLTELRRKAVHAAGSIIALAYYFIDRETALAGLAIINAILLFVEWQRLAGNIRLPEILLRPHEKEQVGAYIYFQIAALISVISKKPLLSPRSLCCRWVILHPVYPGLY